MTVLAAIGRVFIGFLAATGRLTLFGATGVSHIFRPPFYPGLIFRQIVEIGYYSLPVVGLTAVFTGMVLALQSYTGFARFNAESAVATVVVLSITRATNPYKYLIAPRLLAGTLMLPCCVFVADIIGVFGGYLISVHKLGFNGSAYIDNTWRFLEILDVVSGLAKAAVFGFLIALMGCYHGYHSRGGAQGVGAATTNAVVSASILILASNYLITEAFFAQ